MKKLLGVVFLFSLIVSFTSVAPNVNAVQILEGATIKTADNPDVYIVKYKNGKQFKRLVLNPQVFESYGHLRWEDILEVSQSEMDSFIVSDLVRVDGQTDVYQLVPNGDVGTKVLLESTVGYDLDLVYTINGVDFGNYIEEEKIGYSRQKPASIGTSLIAEDNSWRGNYTVGITLLEISQSMNAAIMILDANMYNNSAEVGFDYILAKVKVEYIKGPAENHTYDLSTYSFTAVSSEGKDYDNPFVVEPEPELSAVLYEGASHIGWIAFQVSEDDYKPLMTFNRNYDGTGGIWFKLY